MVLRQALIPADQFVSGLRGAFRPSNLVHLVQLVETRVLGPLPPLSPDPTEDEETRGNQHRAAYTSGYAGNGRNGQAIIRARRVRDPVREGRGRIRRLG